MNTLTCRSARRIKAFCRFRRPTLPYEELTLEEDKRLVGQSLLYDPVISWTTFVFSAILEYDLPFVVP